MLKLLKLALIRRAGARHPAVLLPFLLSGGRKFIRGKTALTVAALALGSRWLQRRREKQLTGRGRW